jgi:hypothetical protein
LILPVDEVDGEMVVASVVAEDEGDVAMAPDECFKAGGNGGGPCCSALRDGDSLGDALELDEL